MYMPGWEKMKANLITSEPRRKMMYARVGRYESKNNLSRVKCRTREGGSKNEFENEWAEVKSRTRASEIEWKRERERVIRDEKLHARGWEKVKANPRIS